MYTYKFGRNETLACKIAMAFSLETQALWHRITLSKYATIPSRQNCPPMYNYNCPPIQDPKPVFAKVLLYFPPSVPPFKVLVRVGGGLIFFREGCGLEEKCFFLLSFPPFLSPDFAKVYACVSALVFVLNKLFFL